MVTQGSFFYSKCCYNDHFFFGYVLKFYETHRKTTEQRKADPAEVAVQEVGTFEEEGAHDVRVRQEGDGSAREEARRRQRAVQGGRQENEEGVARQKKGGKKVGC